MALSCCRLLRFHKVPCRNFYGQLFYADRLSLKCPQLSALQHRFKDTKQQLKNAIDSRSENILTIPNGLSMMRITLSPVLGYFVVFQRFNEAVVVLTVASITDLLDGYIARNYANQKSVLGSFLDPFADKLLLSTLFISMTYADLIPVALTALVLSRDICLVTAASYIRYKSIPEPRTVAKYFDIKSPTVQFFPTFISKLNTALQLSAVGFTLGATLFSVQDHFLIHYLWWATGGTTIGSAVSYLVCSNTYRFLKTRKPRL